MREQRLKDKGQRRKEKGESKRTIVDGLAKSQKTSLHLWFDTCLTDGEPTTFVGRQASP
jgi:hypothetical protein